MKPSENGRLLKSVEETDPVLENVISRTHLIILSKDEDLCSDQRKYTWSLIHNQHR